MGQQQFTFLDSGYTPKAKADAGCSLTLSRATDPQTSRQAAGQLAENALAGQLARVYDHVSRFPDHTSAELASIDASESGLDDRAAADLRHTYARRMSQLRDREKAIVAAPARVCKQTGRKALTWRTSTVEAPVCEE